MKELPVTMRSPRKAKPIGVTDEAWYYVGPKSIEIFGRNPNGSTTSVQITRRQMLQALAIMSKY